VSRPDSHVAAAGATPTAPARTCVALAISGVVAIAFWMRWWPGSLTDARAYWRRDETMYFQLACRFLHGRFDVHDFINPTFYSYVVAVAGAIVGGIRRLFGMDATFDLFLARETAAPHFILWAGRVVSIVASALSVVVVARIGRRLLSPGVGVLAGLLLAIDGVAANSAPLCGNESLMVLLALLACGTALNGTSLRHRLTAGLLIGLATATKYSAGILALPLVVAFGLRVGPTVLAAAAGFVVGSPMAVVNFREFVHGFTTQASFLGAGYSAEDVVRHEVGFVYYVRTFADTHAGVVLALLCTVGICASIAVLVVRRHRSHALLLAASLPLYLYLGAGIFSAQRFLLPALPFIVMHGAWLLDWCLTRIPVLRSRPNGALAVGLLAIVGAGASATVRQHALLRRDFDRPEPKCVLLADLKRRLAKDWKVAELAIPGQFRLLLAQDPWQEMDVPPPNDAIRDTVSGWLAENDLLPTSAPLDLAIATSPTLAELREKLRSSNIDAIVLVLPTRQLLTGLGIRPAPQDATLRACPYWNELFDWIATLPRLFTGRSPDQRLTAAVLDLRDAPR
jgi:hypothetical protein